MPPVVLFLIPLAWRAFLSGAALAYQAGICSIDVRAYAEGGRP